MRVTITIDLEEIDEPTFTDRVHDALLRYIALHIDGGQPGEFVFTRDWKHFGTVVDTSTTLRVEVENAS